MNLGENIKRARERAGITQIALAEKLNVHQIVISRWENNKRTPSAVTFGEICKAIGASADELLELRER